MKFSRNKAHQGFFEPDILVFIALTMLVLGLALPLAAKHYIPAWMALLAVPLFWIALWATIKIWPSRKHAGWGTQVVNHSPSLETQVLDAAFQLVKQSTVATEAKDKLQQMFLTVPFAQITDSYQRAQALGDACYDAADQCRDKRLTDKQAVELLRQQFPGFSPGTYSQALSWGYFLSR